MEALLVDVEAGVDPTPYNEIIVTVEHMIDSLCNRTFEPALAEGAELQMSFDLVPYSIAYLPDAVAFTEIAVRGVVLDPSEWELLNRGGYAENQVSVGGWTRIRRLGVTDGLPIEWSYPFTGGGSERLGLRATARWGFDETTPSEVVIATLQMCIQLYKMKPFLYLVRDEPDLIGGGDETPTITIPDEIKASLAHLVRQPLAEIV